MKPAPIRAFREIESAPKMVLQVVELPPDQVAPDGTLWHFLAPVSRVAPEWLKGATSAMNSRPDAQRAAREDNRFISILSGLAAAPCIIGDVKEPTAASGPAQDAQPAREI